MAVSSATRVVTGHISIVFIQNDPANVELLVLEKQDQAEIQRPRLKLSFKDLSDIDRITVSFFATRSDTIHSSRSCLYSTVKIFSCMKPCFNCCCGVRANAPPSGYWGKQKNSAYMTSPSRCPTRVTGYMKSSDSGKPLKARCFHGPIMTNPRPLPHLPTPVVRAHA